MIQERVFCPSCGAADTSVADHQGVHHCVNCRARYQISGAPGQVVPATGQSNTAVLLAVAFAGIGLLSLMGGGAVVYLLQTSDETEESHMHVPTLPAVVEITERAEQPERAPEKKGEPEGQKKVEPSAKIPTPTTKAPVRPGRPDPALRYRVNLEGANMRGPEDAKVTILIFSDFQCPFCVRVNKSLDAVKARYGKDVRFAYMHNPLGFHKDAQPAALAAEAAGAQGKFWEMHDLLFANQKELTRSNFLKWAGQLGLNMKRFKAALDDPNAVRRIASQQAEAKRLGARGTPAFFINGRFLVGAQPLASFAKLIDVELDVADKLIASGTPQRAVYETLMKDALPGV
jgi:protein-disulfide isomerase